MDNQVELQVLAQLADLAREAREQRAELAELTRQVAELHAKLQPARGEKAVQIEAWLGQIHGELTEWAWPVSWLADEEHLIAALCAIVGKRKSGGRNEWIGIFLSRHLGVYGKYRLELARAGTRDGNLYCVRLV